MKNLPTVVGNKLTTYLLYAIGEIVLVVIGILIAVNINNWNQDRKMDQQELKMLYEIRENLKESAAEVEMMVASHKDNLKSYYILLDQFNQKMPDHDSLKIHYAAIGGWTSPYLTMTAYESLKQKGVDLISNDSLRFKITKMYESYFNYLINDWDRAEWRDSEAIVGPYFTKQFYFETGGAWRGTATPNNYAALIEDPEYKNILTLLVENRRWGKAMGKDILIEIRSLISDIDIELTKRDFKLDTDS